MALAIFGTVLTLPLSVEATEDAPGDLVHMVDAPVGGLPSGECDGYEGFVTDGAAASAQFTYEADTGANESLAFFAISDADIALAVRTPSGEWICNNEYVSNTGGRSRTGGAGGESHPAIVVHPPQDGEYAVWLGAYDRGNSEASAALRVTRVDFSSQGLAVDPEAPLLSLPDDIGDAAREFPNLPVGGSVPASVLLQDCAGHVHNADMSDLVLRYEGSAAALHIWATSAPNAVLAVSDPSGDIHCNDDFSLGSDRAPGLRLDAPERGAYRIWIGSGERRDSRFPARLFVSQTGFPPTWARTAVLSDNFEDHEFPNLRVGGSVLLQDCAGYVHNADTPDFTLAYEGPTALYVWATSRLDTVLTVQDPSGDIHCNDDFSLGSDQAPGLRLDSPERGEYEVWVGGYERRSGFKADLVVSRFGFPLEWMVTKSIGTGFFVSDSGHLLTNDHVVNECIQLAVIQPGHPASSSRTYVLAKNRELDLALVHVEGGTPDTSAAFARDGSTRLGERAIMFGFALDGMNILSPGGSAAKGYVSGLHSFGGESSRLHFDATSYGGMSGAAVLNGAGNVISIMTGVLNPLRYVEPRADQDINKPNIDGLGLTNYGARGEMIKSFLQQNGVDPRAGADARLETPDIVEKAKRFTRKVDCLSDRP